MGLPPHPRRDGGAGLGISVSATTVRRVLQRAGLDRIGPIGNAAQPRMLAPVEPLEHAGLRNPSP